MRVYWLLFALALALLLWRVAPRPLPELAFAPRPLREVERLMQGVFVATRPAMLQLRGHKVSSGFVHKGRASAFVFDPSGYALTAYHAVEGMSALEAISTKQEYFPARVVGFDQSRDLAVIRIQAPRPLEHIEIDFEREIQINDLLVQIGNSGGDFIQPRYGQVQGFIQSEELLVPTRLILSNAYISPGDSGGAVLGFSGKAFALGIGYAQGVQGRVSYLVPLFGLAPWIEQLKRGTSLRLPDLGLRVTQDRGVGLLVEAIVEQSPAAKAGLRLLSKRELRLLQLEHTALHSLRDYHRILRRKKVGERVAVRLKAGERIQNLQLVLE
ncbi:MAG: S1C family serine protease [Deinococcales bacterium]